MPHHAKPAHWDYILKRTDLPTCSCVLELHRRLEALEEQVEENSASSPFCNERLVRRIEKLGGGAPELEVLVGKAMQEAPEEDGHRTWGGMSPAGRAAIYAVAEWLESQGVGAGVAAARWIREDMERV